jgi:DNA-binding MarR family transcriptional regulator
LHGSQFDQAKVDMVLEDHDILGPQMKSFLATQVGIAPTPLELSKALSVDTGLMTRTLDQPEMEGLVGLSRSVDDRRVAGLVLTKKREEIAAEIPHVTLDGPNARIKTFTRAQT